MQNNIANDFEMSIHWKAIHFKGEGLCTVTALVLLNWDWSIVDSVPDGIFFLKEGKGYAPLKSDEHTHLIV